MFNRIEPDPNNQLDREDFRKKLFRKNHLDENHLDQNDLDVFIVWNDVSPRLSGRRSDDLVLDFDFCPC